MRFFTTITIIPFWHEFNLREFELLFEVSGSDRLFEEAYKDLQDFIKSSLIERGLDTTIVPDDLNEFKVWVEGISDWIVDYIEYYTDYAVFDTQKDFMPLGLEISKGQVDKKTKEAIKEIFRKNVYLEEVVAGLKEYFGPNSTIKKDRYDYNRIEAWRSADEIVKDVINLFYITEYRKKE